jgi:DNA repair exonuclease SbcCD ATPase subunit
MEGTKQEDWWFGEYSKYSLKDYKDMLIFQRFSSCVKPYSKNLGDYREAFWRDDNCYILEWFERKNQKGEKFGLDYNSYTYFYEHWYYEEDIHIVEKTWLCDPAEWGVIIKYYPEHEEQVSWSTSPEKKVFETTVKRDEKTERTTKGTLLTPDGKEDFTERFWQTPEGFNREKSWTRGTAKGEEKEAKTGDSLTGEAWTQDENQNSKKKWFQDGNHKWGEGEGKEGYESWKQNWDKDSEGSREEIEYDNRFQKYGKLRVRSQSHNYNVEWEGKKPEVLVSEGEHDDNQTLLSEGPRKKIENQKKKALRSGKDRKAGHGDSVEDSSKPSDSSANPSAAKPGQLTDASKLGFQLSNLYKDLKNDLLQKVEDLKNEDSNKDLLISLSTLEEDLKSLKDPNNFDPQESIAAIQALRDFDKNLTSAEKALVSSQPSADQLQDLFERSATSIGNLAPTLDPGNLSSAPEEIAFARKDFENAVNPKDKVRAIAALNTVVDDLIRASQKTVKDEDKEIAEISQKLAPVLKAFEEALRESQQTLKELQDKFAAKDETVQHILAAYAERSKEVLKDIENSTPFVKTIPKINSVLTDMEKFKKQLLQNDLEKDLQGIQDRLSSLNNSMRTGLGASPSESASHGSSVEDLIPRIQSELSQAQVLSDKLMGKDVSTGDPSLDSIPAKSTETFTLDPADVLKNLWVEGKKILDQTQKSLNTLAGVIGNDEDKAHLAELADQGDKTVTGIPADTKSEALEQLASNLGEFVSVLGKNAEALDGLVQKAHHNIKENELKPETVKDLWKALFLSEYIAEKLIQNDPPAGLEELKAVIEAFPALPKPADMQKALVKYQEIILGLANMNDKLTAEDIKRAEHETDKRLGGNSKSGLEKPAKTALRSSRGARFTFVEPSIELINISFKTTSELAMWVLGSTPEIHHRLESMSVEKEEVVRLLQERYGSEECTDKFLSFLKKLEDAKQGTYTGSEVLPNLSVILSKSEKVLETTGKILETPVPPEAEEIKSQTLTEDLTAYNKRIGFNLSLFFKMVKEKTGEDEGGENFEDALEAMKKKQAVSMLPFSADELLRFLNSRSLKDVKRLKFLAGLIGTDEDVQESNELEEKAASAWPDITNISPQEALNLIENWIHTYPEIENQVESKNTELLAQIVERLLNPEPLEKDVANLLTAIENLQKSAEKGQAGSSLPAEKLKELEARKESIPSNPKELLPYLTSLVKDLSEVNQLNVPALSPEEEAKLAGEVHKKVKTAPVQVVREVQHLFTGPDADDMASVIIKAYAILGHLLKSMALPEPNEKAKVDQSYAKLDKLNPVEVKELGKQIFELLLSLFPDCEHWHEEEHSVLEKRKAKKVVNTLTWADIFKSKGLDVDPELLVEIMKEEQQQATVYLTSLPAYFGTQEHRKNSANLIEKSKEILKIIDEKTKIENYFQLRLEQSKLVASLNSKMQAVNDRINELDKDRENTLARNFTEVNMMVEQNNPELQEQIQLLMKKEDEYKQKELTNTVDALIRLANRLTLEKELQRIKDEAKPKNNENSELIKALSAIEQKLYSELKSLSSFISDLSSELSPSQSSLKHLTEPEVSTTIPGLLASLETGLSSHSQMVSCALSSLKDSPVRSSLSSLLSLISAEMQKDDSETELVFSGLFRLCGSSEDKSRAKKLHEARVFTIEEPSGLLAQASLALDSLSKLLPTRSDQSRLQSKLVKDAGRMREGVDDIDVSCEELLSKAAREAANSILPEDSRSKEALEKLRKVLETINEKPATNIPDCIERISSRLDQWDKLERLRRDLRERSSKEINRLKAEIQDKLNEISTGKANLDAQKIQYDAQIALLQNTADLNASLVEKLTNEAIEKERNLSAAKNLASDLKTQKDELEEDNQKLQDEIDSINKEIRNLRRVNKEKDTQIRELENNLENFERNTEKSSLGDKEKSEILEKLRNETRALREEVDERVKKIEELSDTLAEKERIIKKLDIDRNNLEAELEKIKAERSSLKADLMKTNTEKNELEEIMRLNEGTEEVKQLERILEDKQKELEEAENKLTVAKRYQTLYPELVGEKQEIEAKLREAQIDYEEFKRRAENLKSENDQLKFKLSSSEGLSKDLAEALKENQKIKIRLNFLEQSGDKDTSDLAKKLSNDVAAKDAEVQGLKDEIDRISALLKHQVHKYNTSLSRSFLVRLCHVFKEQEGEGFRKWRIYKREKDEKIDFTPSTAQALLPPSDDEINNPDAYKAADLAIAKTADRLLNDNKIVKLYKSVDHSAEKPMSFINIFKFLEELLDKKLEADKLDFNEQRPILSFPGFMLDYLNKTFGIQSLATRFLNQFLLGFHEIYQENQKYAVLFARILQLFHPDPAPLAASTYLNKARVDFAPLIEKYERAEGERGRKKENSGRAAFEAAGTGGSAFLGDTIELIYSLFPGDKEGGEKALELIKPDRVTIEDYVAFKICHKMAKLGKTPEMIFSLLDKDQGGTIDVSEFISGTKDDLDLWISDKNVTKLLELLDTNGNKEITKESFMSKINMKYLLECNKNPQWTVTRATFLTALLEVFKFKERKLAAGLAQTYTDEEFAQDSFAKIINQLEPNINQDNIEKLYNEAEWNDEKKVTLPDVVRVAGKYGMAEFKSFKIREFVQDLNRRKKVIDLVENQFMSMFKKTENSSSVEGGVTIDREVQETVVVKKKVVKKVLKNMFSKF